MKNLWNEQENINLIKKTIDIGINQAERTRLTALTLLALFATSGCSSNPGHSYGYSSGYYYGGSHYHGRSTYRRSPARRSHYRRRR